MLLLIISKDEIYFSLLDPVPLPKPHCHTQLFLKFDSELHPQQKKKRYFEISVRGGPRHVRVVDQLTKVSE